MAKVHLLAASTWQTRLGPTGGSGSGKAASALEARRGRIGPLIDIFLARLLVSGTAKTVAGGNVTAFNDMFRWWTVWHVNRNCRRTIINVSEA
jgi:hypothetical protein